MGNSGIVIVPELNYLRIIRLNSEATDLLKRADICECTSVHTSASFTSWQSLSELPMKPSFSLITELLCVSRLSMLTIDRCKCSTEHRTQDCPYFHHLRIMTNSQGKNICYQNWQQHCQHRFMRQMLVMLWLTITLTKHYNVVLWLQPGNYFCSFDVPKIFDFINTVWVLYSEKGWPLHYTHVHEFEEQCNFGVVVSWQDYIWCQHEVSSLHPVLECRLRVPLPDTVIVWTYLKPTSPLSLWRAMT